MKVIALDYGSARTGVAVSDPTGTIARPVTVLERAGVDDIAALVEREEAELVVVGMPLTLKGARGEQAEETVQFVEALKMRLAVPVETFDERFTTVLAAGGGSAPEDARAAAHLLEGYLTWSSARAS